MHPVFEVMKELKGIFVLLQEYEEILVPASKPPAFQAGERLIQISELPDWMHPAFEGMKELNRIQSRVSQTALYTAENILMCAPTGAGKTNVAMLTILQEVGPLWALLRCCTVLPLLNGGSGGDSGSCALGVVVVPMSIKTVFPEGSHCCCQLHHYRFVWAIQSDA